MAQDFKIYLDTSVCEHHAKILETPIDKESITTNIDDFLSGEIKSRVAMFHVYYESDGWVDKLKQVYDHCDLIFVFCTELHSHTIAPLTSIDLPRIHIYMCGFINDYKFEHAQVGQHMDWLYTTSHFYLRSRPNFLSYHLKPFAVKPYAFDVLLGEWRVSRNAAYDYIKDNQLDEKVIMTYFGLFRPELEHGTGLKKRGFVFDWDDPNIEFDSANNPNDVRFSVQYVKYYGTRVSMSQIIPLDIYQQTAYTLVAETTAGNEWNFYTEKIAKPILAQRLFVVVSGRHYLKNLRSLGFQTFSNVIDESYDEIEDDHARWRLAMDQVKYLCTQDQTKIFAQIRDTVEHNLGVLKNTDHYYSTFSKIDLLLTNCIPAD